jgi:hypothetical protein
MSVQRKWKAVALIGLVWAATAAQGATAQDKPLLTPPPRSIEWTGASLPLIPPVPIAAVTPEETQVARVLAAKCAVSTA